MTQSIKVSFYNHPANLKWRISLTSNFAPAHKKCLSAFIAVLLALTMFAPRALAQVQYCAQPATPQRATLCYPTLAQAENYLRQEPASGDVGNKYLEKTSVSSLGSLNYYQLSYKVPGRPYDHVSPTHGYWAWSLGDGGMKSCGNLLNLTYWTLYGCASEQELVNLIVSTYPLGPGFGGAVSSDYAPAIPTSWSSGSCIEPQTGLYCAVVYRSGRILTVIRSDSSVYAQMTLNRNDVYFCPKLFGPFDPSYSGWPKLGWPIICGNGSGGTINVHTNQYHSCTGNGNPCIAATGNKEYLDEDFVFEGSPFRRQYNSISDFPILSGFGDNWAHSLSDRLLINTDYPSFDITWLNSSGYMESLALVSNGIYRSRNELGAILYRQTDALAGTSGRWQLQVGGKSLWFRDDGRLIRIVDGSKTLSLAYCDPTGIAVGACFSIDSLMSIVSSTGRKLDFHYSYVSVPIGIPSTDARLIPKVSGIYMGQTPVASYAYDGQGRLSRVYFGDAITQPFKEYHYGEASGVCQSSVGANTSSCDANNFLDFLTSVVDENNVLWAWYGYDGLGRVVSSQHALSAGRVTLNYISNTSVDVQLPTFAKKNYQISDGAFRKPASIALSDAGGNVISNTIRTYNDFLLASEVSPNGSRSEYVYDSFHQVSRTEGKTSAGAATSATRTMQTDWHTSMNVPVEERTYDSTNKLLLRRDWTYNSRAQVLTFTEQDPQNGATRTSAFSYCESGDVSSSVYPLVGLMKSKKGPRDDVDDTESYSYYDNSSFTGTDPYAVGHTIGDLQTVTNALGKVTTYTQYDKHGNVLRMQDANGVETVNTYDLRQRLLSVSVAGQTTGYTYDAAGQLLRITAPDASWIGYEYDAAHRRIATKDNLGNRIDYTLDNAGNQTAQAVSDPAGNLARSLNRSFDALGRVQQTTGRE